MNARILIESDSLQEMQVVNPKDADIIINQIASRIRDPRAAKWMRRTGRHMFLNPDLLYSTPLEVEPEDRGGQRFQTGHAMRPSASYYGPVLPKRNPETGDVEEPTGPARFGWVGKPPEEVVKPGEREEMEMHKRAQDYMRQSKLEPRQQTEAVWNLRRFIRRIVEAEKLAKPYSTNLHRPVIKAGIEQDYEPYKSPRKDPLIGRPQKLSALEPWAKISAKEGAKKEAPEGDDQEAWELQNRPYHFKRFKTQGRRTIQNLNAIADWFNWLKPDDPIFKNLTMPATDVKGYRQILNKAVTWKRTSEEEPWKLVKDYREISKHGPYALHKMIMPETVLGVNQCVVARMGPEGIEVRKKNADETFSDPGWQRGLTKDWSMVKWCTKGDSYAKSYAKSSPLYMVTRDGLPFIQVLPLGKNERGADQSQASTPDNNPIGQELAKEVAPLFNNPEGIKVMEPVPVGSEGAGAIKSALNKLRGL